MRSLALVLASGLALAVPSAGCAAIAARAPDPHRAPSDEPRCNSGKGGVGVDVVVGILLGIGAISVADESAEVAALFAATAGAYAVSAGVGNSAANKCRKAEAQYAAWQEGESDQIGGMPIARPSAPVAVRPPGGTPAQPAPVAEAYPDPQPQPAPVVAPVKPAPAAVPVKPAPAAVKPAPEGGDGDDPWSAFWQEVP